MTKRRFQRYSTVLLKSIENDSPIGQPHRKFSGAYPAYSIKRVGGSLPIISILGKKGERKCHENRIL